MKIFISFFFAVLFNYHSGNIDITSYLFSLLVGFGGLFAFIRSGSLMSLLSGLAFAALLSVGSYKTSQNRKDYHFTLSKYQFDLHFVLI